MKMPFITVKQSLVDHEIETLFEELDTHEPASVEYKNVTEQILKYYGLKNEELKFKHDMAIKVVGVVGTLSAISAIMIFEKTNVIGTKAFGFIPKIGI